MRAREQRSPCPSLRPWWRGRTRPGAPSTRGVRREGRDVMHAARSFSARAVAARTHMRKQEQAKNERARLRS
eukprot:3449775-Rhodomonas_salina.2